MKFFRFSYIFIFIALFAVLTFATPSFAQEKSWTIQKFDSDITLQESGNIHVQETVTFDFVGDFSYVTKQIRKRRLNRVENVVVKDASGLTLSASEADISDGSDSVDIRLSFSKVNETATWIFEYDVIGAVGYFDEYDELYWNATGNETSVAIEQANIRVHLPAGVAESGIRLDHFSGSVGAKERSAEQYFDALSHTALYSLSDIRPFEGLTVLVGFPKGTVQEPAYFTHTLSPDGAVVYIDDLPMSNIADLEKVPVQPGMHTVQVKASGHHSSALQTVDFVAGETVHVQESLKQTLLSRLITIAIIAFIFLVPIAALVINIFYWRRHGKDPVLKKTVIAQYDPPKNFSPMHVGFVVKNAFKPSHFSAAIVWLAERGFLTIHEQKSGGYKLVRTQENVPSDDHSLLLLSKLFGTKKSVTTAGLRNSFYKKLPSIKESVAEELVQQKYYDRRPDKVKTKALFVSAQ